MGRIWTSVLVAVALPVFQVWYAARFPSTRTTTVAKIATFIVVLPVIVMSTMAWAGIWGAAAWVALRAVR